MITEAKVDNNLLVMTVKKNGRSNIHVKNFRTFFESTINSKKLNNSQYMTRFHFEYIDVYPPWSVVILHSKEQASL